MIDVWHVRRSLAKDAPRWSLVVLTSTRSTNDVVRMAAERGLPEGIAVLADEQTAGRGRRGRHWQAHAGQNILLSVLLRPGVSAAESFVLAAIGACSVAAFVERFLGIPATLKWPNDVVVDGAKLAGVLVETVLVGDTVAYAAVGIGLNVNWHPPTVDADALPATSLAVLAGQALDREPLVAGLFDELSRRRALLTAGHRAALWDEWRDRLGTLVGAVVVDDDDGMWSGELRGVGPGGELLVEDGTGAIHALAHGLATVRPRRDR